MKKNEEIPTCPICYIEMKHIKRFKQKEFLFGRKRYKCACGYSELDNALKEEAIINGDYDDDEY